MIYKIATPTKGRLAMTNEGVIARNPPQADDAAI
jgi:hypothetical protein